MSERRKTENKIRGLRAYEKNEKFDEICFSAKLFHGFSFGINKKDGRI